MRTAKKLNSFLFNSKGYSKMNILRVSTGGFRNISDTCLDLSNLTALVALNSYGKSNLLEAIDFGFDFITANSETRRNMMNWSFGIPLSKSIAAQNYYFEIDAETLLGKESYLFNYRVEFEWGTEKANSSRIISEHLRAKKDKKGQKFNLLISREDKACYKSSQTGRCNTPINIEKSELVVNKLQAFDQLYFLSLIKQINSMAVYIDHHLDASTSYDPDPVIRKGINELDINGIQNIPRAIYYLKQEYNDKYELLINAYMQLFPNISKISVSEFSIDAHCAVPVDEDVPFTICDKIYTMKVKDEFLNQPIGFERLSDGAKRVFLMLTFAIIADIKGLSIIAFEEPENSIHPSLLQNYLRTIVQLVSSCKIIVTSHSPYIVQYINPSNIYIGMPNDKGLASFHNISSTKTKTLLKDVALEDTSVGNYIFELMSGSQDDIEQLNKYLEQGNG